MDIKDPYDVSFNFVRFIGWLKDNNVFTTAVAAVLSDRINEVTNVFVNSIIMPIMDKDSNNDGVRDIKKWEDKTITFCGIEFKVGNFALAVFKFLLVTYIIYIIYVMYKKIDIKF